MIGRAISGGMLRDRGWPRGSIDLLLKAARAPEPAARRAWTRWRRSHDFEAATWPEIQLLAVLAARIPSLEPGCPIQPRLDGLAKALWTKTLLAARDVSAVIETLGALGITPLVTGDAARYAEGIAPATIGSLDIRVRQSQAHGAVAALQDAGWVLVDDGRAASPGENSALNLRRPQNAGCSELHLHCDPVTHAAAEPSVDLWGQAQPAMLTQRPILVPASSDALLILLARSGGSDSGAWGLEAVSRLRSQAVDWERFVALATRLRLRLPLSSGLRYLRDELAEPSLQAAIAALSAAPVSLGERLKHWARADPRRHGRQQRLADRLADRLLAPRVQSLLVKDQRPVSLLRPRVPLRWRSNRVLSVHPQGRNDALEHVLRLPATSRRRCLALRLAVPRPAHSRRIFFEVAVDGTTVARLRHRTGGKRAGEPTEMLFHVGLPGSADAQSRVVITACPVRPLADDASLEQVAAIAALPFAIRGAWVLGPRVSRARDAEPSPA